MSWLSSWLNNEPQRDAINRSKNLAKDQADWYKNIFSDTRQDISSGVDSAKLNRTGMYEGQKSLLDNFYESQQGPMMSMMNQIRDSGRNQAARSGLIGGGQEAAYTEPMLQKLGNDIASQAANTQMNLFGNYSQDMAGLDQMQIQGLNQLLSSSMGGLQGANQSQAAIAGQSVAGPFDNILGLIGAGADVAGLFI